jgi:HSP20 family protein
MEESKMSTKLAKNDATSLEPTRKNWRRPRYEVREAKEEYEVRVYLPGVPKGNAEVTLENEQLTIVGRRRREVPANWKQVHSELNADDYRLQLQLNVNVDSEQVQAQVKDGILTVRLPLAEESKPRQVLVE